MIEEIKGPIESEFGLFETKLETVLKSNGGLIGQIAHHLIEMRGKRLRPILLLLSSKALSGKINPEVIEAGVAVEMVHTASLVHDDVIDSSDYRRGIPSINSIWNNHISVLVGDFLFSRALNMLAKIGSLKALEAASLTTERLSRGEILQIESSYALDITEETYYEIIKNKTASLFSASCEIGALLSEASDGIVKLFFDFGEDLGIAFQITDDLLDFIGDSKVFGKPVGTDARERKVTLPLIRALANCPVSERKRINGKIEAGLDGSEDWQEVVDFVKCYDGIDYARLKAEEYSARAAQRLTTLTPSQARDALTKVTKYAVIREK